MSAVLTADSVDVEKIGEIITECKRMNILVLPPNINESLKNFTVVPDKNSPPTNFGTQNNLGALKPSNPKLVGGKIRFGLLAIKNVGTNIIDAIVEERKNKGPFTSITDFIYRVQSKDLNKKSMEALIKAGAFDAFAERNQLLTNRNFHFLLLLCFQ